MARIEVPMPQMGESIAEGTVSKWLKKVGEAVERDEAILEISTDKVDAEIPAPASGTLVEIHVDEGETVEVGTVVAHIDTEAEAAARSTQPDAGGEEPQETATGVGASDTRAPEEEKEEEDVAAPSADRDGGGEQGEPSRPASVPATGPGEAGQRRDEASTETAEDRLRTRSTPVVRRIAAEHGVDIQDVSGSGYAGRVTKQDILEFIEARGTDDDAAPSAPPAPAARAEEGGPAPASLEPSDLWSTFYSEVRHPEFPVREGDEVQQMDKIRRLTAEHMVLAKRIAPHVHSFIEIDFTRVDRVRRENRERWAEQGARVSFTAFVAWAAARVLRDFPTVNSVVSGNNVIYRSSVNIGIAVDLDPGLIVPVIRDADELSLVGIGKRIVDLAERARDRKLSPDEIQGASFSITNPGVLGTLVGMPIIPKGTAAILGTGAIEKRPVVIEDPDTGTDGIAVRKRALFSLGYDHRIVDGADAARFLSALKQALETFPDDA